MWVCSTVMFCFSIGQQRRNWLEHLVCVYMRVCVSTGTSFVGLFWTSDTCLPLKCVTFRQTILFFLFHESLLDMQYSLVSFVGLFCGSLSDLLHLFSSSMGLFWTCNPLYDSCHWKRYTKFATPFTEAKSSDSSVLRGTNSNWDSGLIWIFAPRNMSFSILWISRV